MLARRGYFYVAPLMPVETMMRYYDYFYFFSLGCSRAFSVVGNTIDYFYFVSSWAQMKPRLFAK
jgi:hypothetical protein